MPGMRRIKLRMRRGGAGTERSVVESPWRVSLRGGRCPIRSGMTRGKGGQDEGVLEARLWKTL